MRTHPGVLSGEKNGRSKLTNEQRLQIVSLRKQGTLRKDLAAQFGMSTVQITNICRAGGVTGIYPARWTALRRSADFAINNPLP